MAKVGGATPRKSPCVVPGCGRVLESPQALGAHLRWHRKRNDPGSPPRSADAEARALRKSRKKAGDAQRIAHRTARARGDTHPLNGVTAADFVDGIIDTLYPNGVPSDKVRKLAEWITTTEHIVHDAITARANAHHRRGTGPRG